MNSQEAVAATTGAENPGLAEPGDMKLLGKLMDVVGDQAETDGGSGDGLQTGASATVLDGANLRRCLQHHGSCTFDRIDDIVFSPGRPGGHGLGTSAQWFAANALT